MKTFILMALIFMCSTASASIILTQEQFDNQDIIHEKLRAVDANYLGMSGSKDEMRVYGISDKEALNVINKIDYGTERIKKDKPKKDKMDRIKAELEALNLNAETVEFLLGGE